MSNGKMMPGFVEIEEITPIGIYEAKSAGGIHLPQTVTTGANNHSQVVYGRVIECGLAANRNTIEPFARDTQKLISESIGMNFPLEPGTWVICRNSMQHKTGPKTGTFNDWDVIKVWKKNDPPSWAPKE